MKVGFKSLSNGFTTPTRQVCKGFLKGGHFQFSLQGFLHPGFIEGPAGGFCKEFQNFLTASIKIIIKGF